MCFEALFDGDTRTESVADLIRGEFPAAVKTGVVAATVVAVVLARAGDGVAVGTRVAGALTLGVGLHVAVFLAGVAVVRVHAGLREEGSAVAG